MQVPIDKKAYYMMRFQKGTIIELTEPIYDQYSPKPKGAGFEVDYVDDALQLHGTLSEQGCKVGHGAVRGVTGTFPSWGYFPAPPVPSKPAHGCACGSASGGLPVSRIPAASVP